LIKEKKLKEAHIRSLVCQEEENYRNQFKPEINEVSNWLSQQKNKEGVMERLCKNPKPKQCNVDSSENE